MEEVFYPQSSSGLPKTQEHSRAVLVPKWLLGSEPQQTLRWLCREALREPQKWAAGGRGHEARRPASWHLHHLHRGPACFSGITFPLGPHLRALPTGDRNSHSSPEHQRAREEPSCHSISPTIETRPGALCRVAEQLAASYSGLDFEGWGRWGMRN